MHSNGRVVVNIYFGEAYRRSGWGRICLPTDDRRRGGDHTDVAVIYKIATTT